MVSNPLIAVRLRVMVSLISATWAAQASAYAVTPVGRVAAYAAEAGEVIAKQARAAGNYPVAEAALLRALSLRETSAGVMSNEVAGDLDLLVSLYFEQARFAEAQPLAERAVRMRDALHQKRALAISLSNLGAVVSALGSAGAARLYYERSIVLKTEDETTTAAELAASYNNLGSLLTESGLPEEALGFLRAARELSNDKTVDFHLRGAILTNLSLALDSIGERTEAVALEREALKIWEEHPGAHQANLAFGLHNLGLMLPPNEAVPLLRRAVAIREGLGRTHPYLAASLILYASKLDANGDRNGAISALKRALNILTALYPSGHPSMNEAYVRLGIMLAATSPDESRVCFEKALVNLQGEAVGALRGLLPTERALAVEKLRLALTLWLAYVHPNDALAYDGVLHYKGLVGRGDEAERHLLRAGDQEIADLVSELSVARARVARLAQAVPAEQGQMMQWSHEYAQARGEESAIYLSIMERLPVPLGIRNNLNAFDIQSWMPPAAAIVDYFEAEGVLFAWVTHSRGTPTKVLLGSMREIDPAIDDFRRAIKRARSSGDEEFLATGEYLKGLLWTKVAEHIGENIKTIFVVPDGRLASIPFGALPGRASGSFLQDDLDITYLACAQDIVPWVGDSEVAGGNGAATRAVVHGTEQTAQGGRQTGTGLLLVGDVDYDVASDSFPPGVVGPAMQPSSQPVAATQPRGLRAPQREFAALSGSRSEIDQVGKVFGEMFPGEVIWRLDRGYATVPNIRWLAPQRRVLHFATHGFFRSASSVQGKPTGSDDVLTILQRRALGTDAMMLVGIALAGANAGGSGLGDSGVLTAFEAADLHLDGVELVVLSACDTAVGSMRSGDGVLSLVRGFRQAGAANVVASLWSVEDDSTQMLLSGMYSHVFRDFKGNPTAALAQSARDLRATTRPVLLATSETLSAHKTVLVPRHIFDAPKFWAGFVVYRSSALQLNRSAIETEIANAVNEINDTRLQLAGLRRGKRGGEVSGPNISAVTDALRHDLAAKLKAFSERYDRRRLTPVEDLRVQVAMAELAAVEGRPGDVLRILTPEAMQAAFKTGDVAKARADAFFAMRDWASALDSYTALLEAQPGDTYLMQQVAICELQSHHATAALRQLDSLVECFKVLVENLHQKRYTTDYAITLTTRGNALTDTKDFAHALEEFDRAIGLLRQEVATGNAASRGYLSSALNGRGIALREQHLPVRALADFQEAATLRGPDDDGRFGILINCGIALEDQAKFDDAFKYYDMVVGLIDNNKSRDENKSLLDDLAGALERRATIERRLWKRDEAIRDLDRCIRILTDRVEVDGQRVYAGTLERALEVRGGLLGEQHDARALMDFAKIIEVHKRRIKDHESDELQFTLPIALSNHASCAANLGNAAAAIPEFNAAIQLIEQYISGPHSVQLDVDLARVLTNRGIAYQKLGDAMNAKSDFARAERVLLDVVVQGGHMEYKNDLDSVQRALRE